MRKFWCALALLTVMVFYLQANSNVVKMANSDGNMIVAAAMPAHLPTIAAAAPTFVPAVYYTEVVIDDGARGVVSPPVWSGRKISVSVPATRGSHTNINTRRATATTQARRLLPGATLRP